MMVSAASFKAMEASGPVGAAPRLSPKNVSCASAEKSRTLPNPLTPSRERSAGEDGVCGRDLGRVGVWEGVWEGVWAGDAWRWGEEWGEEEGGDALLSPGIVAVDDAAGRTDGPASTDRVGVVAMPSSPTFLAPADDADEDGQGGGGEEEGPAASICVGVTPVSSAALFSASQSTPAASKSSIFVF